MEIEEELDNLLDEAMTKGKTFNLNEYKINERIYYGNIY